MSFHRSIIVAAAMFSEAAMADTKTIQTERPVSKMEATAYIYNDNKKEIYAVLSNKQFNKKRKAVIKLEKGNIKRYTWTWK